MACYYCLRRQLTIPDGGQCFECNVAVCTVQTRRGRMIVGPHGSPCECRCGRLVCCYDAVAHTQKEGGNPVNCFPDFALGAAETALIASIVIANERRASIELDDEELETFNFLLNHVTPGHLKLMESYQRALARDEAPPASRRMIEQQGVIELHLEREFFNEGALERLALLAASTAWSAWSLPTRRREHFHSESPMVGALDRHTLGAPDRETAWADMLVALAPEGQVPSRLLRAFSYQRPPDSDDVIADWIIAEPAYV